MITKISQGDRFGKTLLVKLSRSPAVSSIKGEKFLLKDLTLDEDIADAFGEIDTPRDYDVISRVVTLTLSEPLVDGNEYELTVTGLKSATNLIYPDESGTFTAKVDEDNLIETPPVEPAQIEDHSIIGTTPGDFGLIGDLEVEAGGFGVVATDPPANQWFLDEDYNDGLVSVVFSKPVDPSYINEDYFKLSRKKVQIAPIKWEAVDVKFMADETLTKVRMQIKDLNPPVEMGYIYKLTVSGDVKASEVEE